MRNEAAIARLRALASRRLVAIVLKTWTTPAYIGMEIHVVATVAMLMPKIGSKAENNVSRRLVAVVKCATRRHQQPCGSQCFECPWRCCKQTPYKIKTMIELENIKETCKPTFSHKAGGLSWWSAWEMHVRVLLLGPGAGYYVDAVERHHVQTLVRN
jgi:hypothetical protein